MTKERIKRIKGCVVAFVAALMGKVLDAVVDFVVERGLDALSKIL